MSNPQLTIVRRRYVMEEIGLTESTMYRRMQEGLFMKPVPISQRCVGWVLEQVQQYNALIASGASDDDIREFVESVAAPSDRNRNPRKKPTLDRIRVPLERVRVPASSDRRARS
jgi:predicted DNA-binding transcriptional regulator AlpA